MSPLCWQHHDTTSTKRGRPHRRSALAMTTALMLALSACSPGQDPGPSVDEESAPATIQSEPSTPETDEPPATPDVEDDGSDDVAPTTAPDAGDEDAEDSANEVASETAPPTSFEIPAIGAGSELLHLGLRDDGTLEVPPGDPGSPASWYTGSPAPGEQGPSVLLGHVDDSLGQPGVFADLPALVEGDEISISREDGGTSTFVVTRAEQYGKNTFPTLEVYGNTEDPELRLITCDGYDQATGEYEDNYVVYATLVS